MCVSLRRRALFRKMVLFQHAKKRTHKRPPTGPKSWFRWGAVHIFKISHFFKHQVFVTKMVILSRFWDPSKSRKVPKWLRVPPKSINRSSKNESIFRVFWGAKKHEFWVHFWINLRFLLKARAEMEALFCAHPPIENHDFEHPGE